MAEDCIEIAAALRAASAALSEETTNRYYAEFPEIAARFGPMGRKKCVEDAQHHLAYLAAAVSTKSPALFENYVGWAAALLAHYDVHQSDLGENLRCLRAALIEQLPPRAAEQATAYLDSGLRNLRVPRGRTKSFLSQDQPYAELASTYLNALLHGDRKTAQRAVLDAVAAGMSEKDVYLHVFQPCQFEIGRLWHERRVSVAHEHYCTAVTQTIMGHLYVSMFHSARVGKTAVVCCVGQELHELGARMVADFFEMNGWDSIYLGANTPAREVVTSVTEHEADIVCLSVTLTRHIAELLEVISALRAGTGGRRLPILVGGNPFRLVENLWKQVGADGFAPDAQSAVNLANGLVSG